MSYNLSALFERVVDAVPDRLALASPARRLTYRELDDRANQLAHWLRSQGVAEGTRVGLYLLNGSEYLEGMLACFKLRAAPININHRYVARELAHIIDDSELTAMIVHHRFLDTLRAATAERPLAVTLVVRDFETVASQPPQSTDGPASQPPQSTDGPASQPPQSTDGPASQPPQSTDGPASQPPQSTDAAMDYEAALAGESADRDFEDRSGDDLYIVYTGGTTGMPKGVIWRHEDLFFGALGGGDPLLDKGHITDPDQLGSRVPDFPVTQLCTPPLMHVSAHWGAFNTFFGGGKVVLMAPGVYVGDAVWETVAAEAVNVVVVVGDAMARPDLEALERLEDHSGLSSMLVFASGGAVLSGSTKAEVKRLLPNVILVDTFGSSETGLLGTRSGDHDAGVRFTVDERTAVLTEDGRPVTPGSDEIGRLARRGHLPLGYLGDEEKTAATFVEYDGKRWVIPGDLASVAEDGTVILHGRGSGCINTGGEKVFPEEVESVLKAHETIADALVVGLPDEKWGQRVVAVFTPRPDATPDTESLETFARQELSAYKVPKQWVETTEVLRGSNGKPDYARAKSIALAGIR